MIDFYRTPGGRRFIDHTVPDLALQMQRVALGLNRLIDLLEEAQRERRPSHEDGRKEGT